MKIIVYISLLFIFFSCKKEVNSNGYELVANNESYKVGADSLDVLATTKPIDSIISGNPSYLFLGIVNDPVFGVTKAGFCSQLRLTSTSPNFGNVNIENIDSVVLSIKYDDVFGVNSPMRFEVYRLTDDLTDQTYYINSKISDNSENLVVNQDDVLPRYINQYYINNFGDTIYDQISLKLNTKLGKEIIEESQKNPATFASIEAFNSWFKGMKVIAKRTTLLPGDGGVYYISTPPRLTIYYKLAGVSKKYYFELNQNGHRLNLLDTDINSTEYKTNLENDNSQAYYCRSNDSRAFLKISNLSGISRNSVIHSAVLELPYDNFNQLKYSPGNQISIMVPNSLSDSKLRIIGYGDIDTLRKVYRINLRDHIQSVVTGKRLDLGLYISPREFSTTFDRIRFFNDNEKKPKLYLKISSFKQ